VAGGQRYLHHAVNDLELTALRWLAELCGIPVDAAGVFTSGGSTANLIALGAARQAAFERVGVDVAEDGVPPGARARIYASTRAHRTVHRAAAALGLGRSSVREIATDRAGHIDVDAVAAALDEDRAEGVVPIAVVATAGTTDTGSVDALAEPCGSHASTTAGPTSHDCWTHVDGAYGLVAHASRSARPLFAGVADADSWIVDPHKWLATGVGVGAAYVRDGDLLTRAFSQGHADYLESSLGGAVCGRRVAVRRDRRAVGRPVHGAVGPAAWRPRVGRAVDDLVRATVAFGDAVTGADPEAPAAPARRG
jgi:aromatic-L-amino-acid decarboxylase